MRFRGLDEIPYILAQYARRPDVKKRLYAAKRERRASSTPNRIFAIFPNEILELIFKRLDPVGAACFGLSCRVSYDIFKRVYPVPVPLDTCEPFDQPPKPSKTTRRTNHKKSYRPGGLRKATQYAKPRAPPDNTKDLEIYRSFLALGECLQEWMGKKYRNWTVEMDDKLLPAFHYLPLTFIYRRSAFHQPVEEILQSRYRDYVRTTFRMPEIPSGYENSERQKHECDDPRFFWRMFLDHKNDRLYSSGRYVSLLPNPFNKLREWSQEALDAIYEDQARCGLDDGGLEKFREVRYKYGGYHGDEPEWVGRTRDRWLKFSRAWAWTGVFGWAQMQWGL